MSKPTLTYFNGRGRAEVARLILAEAGVEYNDHRFDDMSPSLKEKLPFGQVPLYEEEGLLLVQSMTIARYLARKHHLAGKDDKEAALCDMAVDGIVDVQAARNAAKTDEEKKKFAEEVLPKWLGYFEKLLGGKEYSVGGHLTWADIVAFNSMSNISAAFPGCLDHFPSLKAHRERIGSRPNIKKWVDTRPQTAF